jgi:hypothetical protein
MKMLLIKIVHWNGDGNISISAVASSANTAGTRHHLKICPALLVKRTWYIHEWLVTYLNNKRTG